jgi:microcystin-dependent protein
MIKLNKTIGIYLLCTMSYLLNAQVGINTKNPHASAALDIKPLVSNGAVGLIIPNISQAQIDGLTKSNLADGLLVYNTDLKKFQYFSKSANEWWILNGLKTQITSTAGINDTTSTHFGRMRLVSNKTSPALEVNGSTQLYGDLSSNATITATKVKGEGAVPAGTIVMWSGNPNSLPTGWALCDGTNGTPNLKGRFIVGYDPADTDYNTVNKTGPSFTDADGSSDGTNTQDAKQVKLLASQSGLPGHSHDVNDPGHTHTYTIYSTNTEKVGDANKEAVMNDINEQTFDNRHLTTREPTGIIIEASDPLSANQSFENRPPYYVLAYIIKLNY